MLQSVPFCSNFFFSGIALSDSLYSSSLEGFFVHKHFTNWWSRTYILPPYHILFSLVQPAGLGFIYLTLSKPSKTFKLFLDPAIMIITAVSKCVADSH